MISKIRPNTYPQGVSEDESKIVFLLKTLTNAITESHISDIDLLQICIKKQNLLSEETISSLLTLSNAYTKVFLLSKQNKIDEAANALKQANKTIKLFSFTSQERNIFRILTYPRISYFYYKSGKHTIAKWYLKFAININNTHLKSIPFFNFFTFQQRNNYATLNFKTNQTSQGIQLLLQNLRDMLKEKQCMQNTTQTSHESELAAAALCSLIRDSASILLRELENKDTMTLFNRHLKSLKQESCLSLYSFKNIFPVNT